MTFSKTLDYLYQQLPMYQRIGQAAYKADLNSTVALMSHLGNPENQSPITNFRWEFVKQAFGKKYNLTYCTRQYIIKKMKNPYVLGYEDWYVGAVNNENQFYGGNINQAQALYYKNI